MGIELNKNIDLLSHHFLLALGRIHKSGKNYSKRVSSLVAGAVRSTDWREITPRIIADFITIHGAMLMAFAISVSYQTRVDGSAGYVGLVSAFRGYYFSFFILLSVLFPIVFFVNGFYTYVRPYPAMAKFRRFGVVVLFSLAIFISANFMVLQTRNPVGRSVAIPFAVIALCGLLGIRLVKEWLIGSDRAERSVKSKRSDLDPILVIGGAGYIGCWLIKRLLEQGRRVRVLDNAVYGLESIRSLLANPKLEHLDGDCRNIQDVVKAMRGVSSVVHLAAIVGDPACEIDRKTTIEINYAATRMLVEIAKGYGVERFLFASSCSVYGATDELMDEDSRVDPISLYGETKVSSEMALLEAASSTFHPVILRFATVFGLSNRPRFDLVVNLLSAKARQDGVITIFNGQQWRPFVHVKDLAEAIMLLLQAPLNIVSREVFNVGDNRLNHTLSEVASTIQRVFPGTKVEHVENSDKRNYRVDFTKIQARIGFRCLYDLEDGVRQIKAAFDLYRIDDYRDIRFSNLVFLRETGAPGNKSDIDAEVMAAFCGEHIPHAVAMRSALPYSKTKAAASR
jgi:nucleoside-diphosphate-sugar epimerase